jgi:anti-sigma factor RsiW
MNCAEFEDAIILYYLDELTGDERVAVEEHRARCAQCSARAAGVAAAVQTLTATQPDGHVSLWPRVRERIMAPGPSRRKRLFVPALATVAVGTAFLLLPLWYLRPQVSSGDREMVTDLEFVMDYELWEQMDALESTES